MGERKGGVTHHLEGRRETAMKKFRLQSADYIAWREKGYFTNQNIVFKNIN